PGAAQPLRPPAGPPGLVVDKGRFVLPDQKCSGDKRRPRAIQSLAVAAPRCTKKWMPASAIAAICRVRDRRPGTCRCLIRFEETGLLGGAGQSRGGPRPQPGGAPVEPSLHTP